MHPHRKNIGRGLAVLLGISLGLGFSSPIAAEEELQTEGKAIPFVGNVRSAISAELSGESALRVALLPATADTEMWDAWTRDKEINAIAVLRKVFFGRFSVCAYPDVHVRDVDRLLAQEGIPDARDAVRETSGRLGQILGADALIYMHIKRADNVSAGVHSYTGYDATVRMVRAVDGTELWKAELAFANRGGLISLKSSQVGSLIEFEKENRKRKKAFRLVAQEWSRRVVHDLREKLGEEQVGL